MEFHEAANLFPIMTGDSYRALRDDVAANGLLEPIVLYEGKILDGRNRYTVCLELGITPQYETYSNGDNPVAFVISKNLHRRHLNETQRALIAGKLANMNYGDNQYTRGSANLPTLSQPEAASMLNVSDRTVRTAKAAAAEMPELLPKMEAGEMSAHEAEKKVKEKKRQEERNNLIEEAATIKPQDRWNVYHGDITDWHTDKQYDFIITDPPYPKEYIDLYGVLAKRAQEWLKPSGLLIAMCGQSYLDAVIERMNNHLYYYWTACYLLPGQPTPLRKRQVNTSWKPLLIYALDYDYKGKIFGDVFKSDGNDKDFHKWGQSVSGMYSIISQICLPGQSILDPFCGAGATGIAALQHGCLFDGIDIDENCVKISKSRMIKVG